MTKFPTYEEMGKKVAEKALDGYIYKGKTLREWIDILDQTQWIPVSERLPELGIRVLCQCQANIYEVLRLTVDGWCYDLNHCYMESFVIAWMPLPKPYGESEE